MSRAPIVVAGSINVDYALATPRIPLAGETLTGDAFAISRGGKGANQAVACCRLGATTVLIGCVGDDAAGRDTLIALTSEGLITDQVTTVRGQHTGSAVIFVAADGENCIGISAGANAALDESRIRQHAAPIESAHYLLVQLETPLAGVRAAIDIAKAADTQVILNPAPACELDDALLAGVDILTPNQGEAALLSGLPCDDLEQAERASEALIERGAKTVIITLGAHGALVNDGDSCQRVPAPDVEAVDTVAAGDTFSGALAVALVEGQSLLAAVDFANRAAAVAVTRRGAQDAIPRRREVEATP